MSSQFLGRTVKYGVFAGIAGGTAEIVWIIAAGILATISATNVAYRVVVPVGLKIAPSTLSVVIAIHMAVAVALGIAVAVACFVLLRRALRGVALYVVVVTAMVGDWAFNFFVLLPMIDTAFVHVVPYPISLLSKLLFGLAAAEVLRRGRAMTRSAPMMRMNAS